MNLRLLTIVKLTHVILALLFNLSHEHFQNVQWLIVNFNRNTYI